MLFVCSCGYFASRHDTVRQHQDACHGRPASHSIHQVDKANWARARDFIMLLPNRMPELPLDRKTLVTTRKKRVNTVDSKSPSKKELSVTTPEVAKAKTVFKPRNQNTPPRPVKVTKIDKSDTPITVTIPVPEKRTVITTASQTEVTVSKETKAKISEADRQRYITEINDSRKYIASQTAISNELRRMSENLEKQTEMVRKRVDFLLELLS